MLTLEYRQRLRQLKLQKYNVLQENNSLKTKLADKNALFKDLFIEKVTKSDLSIRKFTGIPNLELFNKMKDTAVNFDQNIRYWSCSESELNNQNQGQKRGPARKLSKYDEFILTLVRLRLALPVFVMSELFGVSSSRVSSIFTTWMFCLYYLFKDCIAWPSRERINRFMPKSFKKNFPKTRAIIDCTEKFSFRDPKIQP